MPATHSNGESSLSPKRVVDAVSKLLNGARRGNGSRKPRGMASSATNNANGHEETNSNMTNELYSDDMIVSVDGKDFKLQRVIRENSDDVSISVSDGSENGGRPTDDPAGTQTEISEHDAAVGTTIIDSRNIWDCDTGNDNLCGVIEAALEEISEFSAEMKEVLLLLFGLMTRQQVDQIKTTNDIEGKKLLKECVQWAESSVAARNMQYSDATKNNIQSADRNNNKGLVAPEF